MLFLLTISLLIMYCNVKNVLTTNGFFTKYHPHIYRKLQHYLYNMISNDIDVTVKAQLHRIFRTYRIMLENCLISSDNLQYYETYRNTLAQYLCGNIGYTGINHHIYVWKINHHFSSTKMFIAFIYINLPFKGTICLRNNICHMTSLEEVSC